MGRHLELVSVGLGDDKLVFEIYSHYKQLSLYDYKLNLSVFLDRPFINQILTTKLFLDSVI